MKEDRKHTSGVIGAVIVHVILLLLLYFFGFTQLIPEKEEGILINFGDSPTGSGAVEPSPAEPIQNTPPPPPPTTVAEVTEPTQADVEKINTQEFEEAAAIKSAAEKKKKEDALKKKKAEDLKRQKAIEEQKRVKAIEAEKQRIIEEQKRAAEQLRLEQERIAKAELEAQQRQAAEISSRTKNAFATGKSMGSSTSEGNTGGTGNQGSLNGDPNSTARSGTGLGSKGNSYSLSGRSLVGSLPSPVYTIQEEGIVVVAIEVNNSGIVTNATPILRGSTTQNPQLWKMAKEAALRAKFNADPSATTKQLGTITYHFQLD